MLCWSGLSKSGQIRDVLREFQGYDPSQGEGSGLLQIRHCAAGYVLGVMLQLPAHFDVRLVPRSDIFPLFE